MDLMLLDAIASTHYEEFVVMKIKAARDIYFPQDLHGRVAYYRKLHDLSQGKDMSVMFKKNFSLFVSNCSDRVRQIEVGGSYGK